ncbi:MAG TPA: asparagine synthase C-terminal domain-containing protein [Methanomassiliicoccales archaeon]|nr:asparagine synthase C-terminal domain-containing protein [Methanomassiliicoccales archaeon]
MTLAEELVRHLRKAIDGANNTERGVLFSGGLDSTVIAHLAGSVGPVRLYTIGTSGSHDLMVAEETADLLGLEWKPLLLSDREIVDALVPLSEIIGTDSPLTLSFELPLYFVCERARENDFLSGQGADELFAGYMRYLSLPLSELKARMNEDLDALLSNGVAMERAIARRFSKEIHHPFLDPHVVAFARTLPTSECLRGSVRKAILRDAAANLGLDVVVGREKKAAQYGSGVMKVIKAEARKRGVATIDLVGSLRRRRETV